MFKALLIANRGEVAARVARTAKRMGIRTVVVASTVDRKLAWLDEVDEVVVIGPASASKSYLDADAIIWNSIARFLTRCSTSIERLVGRTLVGLYRNRFCRGLGVGPIILGAAGVILLAYLVADKSKIGRYRKQHNRWAIPFCIVSLALFGLMVLSG